LGNQPLTAWDMARPFMACCGHSFTLHYIPLLDFMKIISRDCMTFTQHQLGSTEASVSQRTVCRDGWSNGNWLLASNPASSICTSASLETCCCIHSWLKRQQYTFLALIFKFPASMFSVFYRGGVRVRHSRCATRSVVLAALASAMAATVMCTCCSRCSPVRLRSIYCMIWGVSCGWD
jgi:hypothetical protein